MPPKRRPRLRSAVATGVRAISAGVGLASGGPGIISGIAQASSLVLDAFAARQQARGARMLRAAFDAPEEEFPKIISEKLKNEQVRDALLEAMRTALEAMADEVMPALGGLIREYEKESRRADGFFRGCCRLLQDLSAEEFASFVALINRIDKAPWNDQSEARGSFAHSREEWASAAEGAPVNQPFLILSSSGLSEGGRSLAAVGSDPAHGSRLFHLLDRENFGHWHAEGRGGANRYLTMQVGTARRIARILK